MPIEWVAAPDEASVERITTALAGPAKQSGVALVGPDGAGKTELARAAAMGFSEQHQSEKNQLTLIRWVTGTESNRAVPFGALHHLIDVAEIGKPAALLRAARDSLTRGRGGDDLILVVDDAHELDDLSATLVYQLALTGAARLIVTARADSAIPGAVAALWTDDLLTRIDVDPPAGAGADRVSGLIDGFLAGVAPGVREVLNNLAVAEPLPKVDLAALTCEEAVADAQAAGAVWISDRDGGELVYAGHPRYAAAARAALGSDAIAKLCSAVVAQLSQHPSDHVSDRLRLAVLALDSDAGQPLNDAVAAATEALRLGDVKLAERLARAALERSGELAARLPLATALGWQGRGREADTVLAAVDPDQLSQPELMAWALPRAANQFFMLDEPERAMAFLQTARNRVSAPAARNTLDALSATFAMNAGNLPRAVAIATEVLDSPASEDMAVAWAASTGSLCSARMGRLDEVEPFAGRALAAEHPGLLRFTIGLGQTTALLMAGDLPRAADLAQQFTDFAELQQPGRAIGDVLLAHVLLAGGDFAAAATLLSPAAAALDRTGYSWGPLSLMLLATTLAQQGDIAGAAKALSRAESRHGTKSALFAPELGLARAWSRAARRDMPGAITAARDAAKMAERGGQSAVALRAWHDAVRLGDVHAADPLARIAEGVDCAIGTIAVAHARALATGDAAALGAVADALAAAGMHAAAADAAAQASGQPPG